MRAPGTYRLVGGGADEWSVRRLVGSWLAETVPDGGGPGTGLPVPPAGAGEVIAAARRIATRGLGPVRPEPPLGLRRVVQAMVLDEHPSGAEWSWAERETVLDWTTLLVHRFGEDGVQLLVAELGGQALAVA